MDLARIAARVDERAARAFVNATWNVVQAMLVRAEEAQPAGTPQPRDYEREAAFSRETPAGGWIAPQELRAMTQRMAEAIAAEKWVEGVVFAIQAIALLRP